MKISATRVIRRPTSDVRRSPRGFTLVELLTGMTVSILTVAGIMNLFFLGSRHLQRRQQEAMVADNLQASVQQVVNEVRWAVTRDPRDSGVGAGAVALSELPQLPYNTVNLTPPVGPVLPAVPALGKFDLQLAVDSSSPQAKYFLWFPNPMALSTPRDQSSNQNESNYMTFYKVSNGIYHRITYTTGTALDDPNNRRLIKIDRPFNPTTHGLDPPVGEPIVLLDYVKTVQFTYPLLLQKMAQDPSFENTLLAKLNQSQTDLDLFLNQDYRGVVDIRLACYVPRWKTVNGLRVLDTAKSPVQEARAQVSVRN